MTEDKVLIHSEDIYHWGIHGQQWGKRRYQNEDGSLTPLGRIHYGVGEAKERSKIKIREMKAETKSAVKLAKAQAKAAKAVANAEKEKIAAKTKEYRDRKEADNIVELERIKAQREADRQDAKNEAQLNKNLAEATKENANVENKSSAVKAVLGIMAAAGVGYLIYKAASNGSKSSNKEVAEKAVNKIADKPISEVTSKASNSDKNLVNMTLVKAEKGKKWFSFGKTEKGKKWLNDNDVYERLTKDGLLSPKTAKEFVSKTFTDGTTKVHRDDLEQTIRKMISSGFAFKHSDNNGLILVHSAKGPDVQHWGILGMKWGVRRWQNEDGTLTPEGRIHYARKDTKKFEKAKNYASKYKIANESEIIKDFKKNSGEYADLNKHYNELKSLGENVTEQQAKDFQEATRGVRQAAAEFIEKYSDKPANLMAIYAWDDENRRAYEIRKQSRIKIEREAMESLKKEDLFDEQRVKEDPKRADEAAKLGLKALAKQAGPHSELDPNDKGFRDWFIWEDQTIGLATIADLVNQGKSSSEIKAIVKAANSITDDETASSQSGVWQLANSGYSWKPEAIDDFVDACIEVKKEESKIKHSDYDGGNSICLTKLF